MNQVTAEVVVKRRQTTEAADGKRIEIMEHCAALFDKDRKSVV